MLPDASRPVNARAGMVTEPGAPVSLHDLVTRYKLGMFSSSSRRPARRRGRPVSGSTTPTGTASPRPEHLGDFDVDARMLKIAGWAIPVGAVSALLAFALLRLIGLITNLVFYQRWNAGLVAPGDGPHHPFWLVLLAPAAGGLVVGVMARLGSEKIRGHGMPEAIEAILVRESRIEPRVALLKPISAAISIGTGGPFGAEGPIIMTGGAAGSILAQHLHLSADERKTLLVAGAAGGMAATFNAPLASVVLAVELLLFEWRPRSFVPVVAAVATGTVARGYLLGTRAVFALPSVHVHLGAGTEGLCVLAGLTGGVLAIAATGLVYASEDLFHRLPIHWMWWPALGGLIIGAGGLVEPRALGVGYDVIDELLTGRAGMTLIVGILVVKTSIWGLSLGSGTSGGVMAPVFMIGAALGALEGHLLPPVVPGFWALVGLAAVLGGVMRSPLTGVVFPLELTHAWPLLLPLLIAATSAYALSTIALKRSVLTEKIARRGLHLTREYSIDPLEVVLARDVMRAATEHVNGRPCRERRELRPEGVVHADDTLRQVANRFAVDQLTQATVAERADPGRPIGEITLADLLQARLRDHHEEHDRERLIGSRWREGRGGEESPPPLRNEGEGVATPGP
jgi:CIC family chloride channel protein